jgi:hypothetical protein
MKKYELLYILNHSFFLEKTEISIKIIFSVNSTDPFNQLAWLVHQLELSEKHNEKLSLFNILLF